MEEMMGQRMRPLLSLSEFLANYKETLKVSPCIAADNAEYLKKMEEQCALSKLENEDDPLISEYVPGFGEQTRKPPVAVPANAFQLRTFEALHQHHTITISNTKLRNPFQRIRDSAKPVRVKIAANATSDLNSLDELLIWIRIYRPARATHKGQTLEKPVFDQEFVCLGSNYLTELRDKISCISNGKRFFDISDDPKQHIAAKETDPAFFFITDTFYNDMRNKNNADYSEIIRSWKEKTQSLKHVKFHVGCMQSTRFIDLNVSLGFPQLYQHHGSCEHVFTFSQVEVLTDSANKQPRAMYPQLKSFSLFNDRVCNLCGNFQFVFIVEGSNRQLHDPAYLCENCFMRYHYENDKKIGEFKAYRLKEDAFAYRQEFKGEAVCKAAEQQTAAVSNESSQKPKENKKKVTIKNEEIETAASSANNCKERLESEPEKERDINKRMESVSTKNTQKSKENKKKFAIKSEVIETAASGRNNCKERIKFEKTLSEDELQTIDLEAATTELVAENAKCLENDKIKEQSNDQHQNSESWSYMVEKIFSDSEDEDQEFLSIV